ncbi:retrovirus-related pol polyprotein from transposon TNT 1-94 [Tanacetum coccineum]
MATNEETNAAGTDTRPPMLVESDYESWKIRIHSHGLPRHIFNTLNQTSTAKEIWDNYVVLMPRIRSTLISKLLRGLMPKRLSETGAVLTSIVDQLAMTSSNSRTHATVHDGHIVTEPIQRKAPGNVGNTGARGKKVICYNCRGEGHVARQCKEQKRKMDSQYFKDKALLMEAKEKGDVLDAEAEAFLADVECTAPYDQPQALTTTNMFQANHEDAYDSDVDEGPNAAVAFMANTYHPLVQTNNSVNEVIWPKRAQNVLDVLIRYPFASKLTIPLVYGDSEEVLVHQFVPKQERSPGTGVLVPAIERASQTSIPNSPVTPFVRKCRPQNLTIEKKNLLIKNDCLIAECLENDICSIVLSSDIVVPPSSNCLCEDLRSVCDREHTKVLKLEAEVLKQQKMVIEFEKRKDETIRNLDAQISIMKVLNVGSTTGSCDQQALETERIQLKDTITSLRIQLDGLTNK